MSVVLQYACIKNRPLKWNIISSSVIGTATLAMAWLVQPMFVHLSLPLVFYGIFIPILNLTTGTVSIYAHTFEKKMGFGRTLATITIGVPAMYIALGWFDAIWALVFLLIFYVIRGIATPVLKNHINVVTPSEIRATVLSIRSLIIRLAFVVISPMLGWYADDAGLPAAMLSAGTLFLVIGLFASARLIHYRSDHKAVLLTDPS